MAQLAIAAVGALALGPVGLGLTTAGTGFMLGSLAYSLMAPGQKSYGPRLNDLKVTGTDYGSPIPWIAGSPRVAGQIIWASERRETATEEEQGKGGGPSYTSYTYDVDLLILLSENEIESISRAWLNGELVLADGVSKSGQWVDLRAYSGAADQLPDPTYEAAVGVGNAPAYRGMGTVLIQGLQLGNSGNIPNLTFEIGVGGSDRKSVLVSVMATRADTNAFIEWDPLATGQPTWDSFFSEFHAVGAMDFVRYTTEQGAGEAGSVSSLAPMRIDVGATYRLSALNAFWAGDDCQFSLEFLNSAGQIVAIIRTDGRTSGEAFSHYLFYGSSYASLTRGTFIGSPPHCTNGFVTFEEGELKFKRDTLAIDVYSNDDFSFACDALSIVSVRAVGVFARSSYSGPIEDPYAYVRFQRITDSGGFQNVAQLGAVIDALMKRSGYADADYVVDESIYTALVRALAIGSVSNTRSALEALAQGFFLEVSACEQISVRARSREPVALIPFVDLGMGTGSGGDEEPLSLTLGNDLELPAQLALSYANVAGDYQTATEFSDRLLSGQQSTETIQTPLGLLPAEAKAIVDGLLMDRVASLATATLKLPLKYSYLEPGDVVSAFNSDGRSYRLRVQSKTDAMPIIELQCVLDDVGAIESEAVTDTGYVNTDTVIQPAATLFEALDIPILRDADDAPGYYMAVAPQRVADTDTWPGAAVAQAWDEVNYVQLLTTTAQCVMGTATTALPAWQGGPVFDESSTVTVQVSGELASSTRAAMLLDESINSLLLGSEILRFRSAALLSAGTYLLSGLLRGQRGTEWAMGGHAAGERCVLLGNSLRRLGSQTNEIGLQRQIKAVTLGQFLSAGTAKDFTDTGVALKPFSPANPRALPDGLDLAVSWQRRTRRSYQYSGPAPVVPLGEAVQAYRVRVFAGSTLLRSDVVNETLYRYTGDMQAADGLASGAAVQFEICQLSATVGPGYPSFVGATTV